MSNKRIKVGDQVPFFSLKDQNGNRVSVEDFLGRPFVIFFYPKDDTPGCVAEACSFRDSYTEFRNLGAEVVGISADNPQSHREFIEKYKLPFVLLSDERNGVRKMFGVPGVLFGLLPGRVTYVCDGKGVVLHIFNSQMEARKHVKEALGHLKNIKSGG